MNGMVYIERM